MLNMNTLEKDGIDHIGAYKNEEASKQVKTTKMGDLTIGWVCHTFSVNNKPLPPDKPWIVDITLFDLVETLIRCGSRRRSRRPEQRAPTWSCWSCTGVRNGSSIRTPSSSDVLTS